MPLLGFHRHRWEEVHWEHTMRERAYLEITDPKLRRTVELGELIEQEEHVGPKVTIITEKCTYDGCGMYRQHILEGHLPLTG